MRISSPAFQAEPGGTFSSTYTCNGENISPGLTIRELPEGTQAVAVIFDDFDASIEPNGSGRTFDHWLVVCPATNQVEFPEGGIPAGALELMNHFGRTTYGGPCPPSFKHIYTLRVYALDAQPSVKASDAKEALLTAMQGHVLDSEILTAKYAQPHKQ